MMLKYPSIDQFKHTVQNVRRTVNHFNLDQNQVEIEFTGTVKLHGTNASILLVKSEDGNFKYQVQSRTNILSIDQDNYGFCQYALKHEDFYSKVLNSLLNTLPDESKDKVLAIGVYGEYAGKGVQKSVAISEVDKFFAPFDIAIFSTTDNPEKLSTTYLPVESLNEFNNPDVRCYPVSLIEPYKVKLKLSDVYELSNVLQDLTLKVEEECPFAKQVFNVSGIGEGVVWKSEPNEHIKDRLVFKVKGEKHAVSKVKTLAPVDFQAIKAYEEAADCYCTDNRLFQGLQSMQEMRIERTLENISEYIKWVQQDIWKEEQDEIQANDLVWKKLTGYIAKRAVKYYKEHLNDDLV